MAKLFSLFQTTCNIICANVYLIIVTQIIRFCICYPIYLSLKNGRFPSLNHADREANSAIL